MVYRAELHGCGAGMDTQLPDTSGFALTGKNSAPLAANVHTRFFILEPQAAGARPIQSVLTTGAAANFALTYQGRALDTMTGRRRERMRIRRDLDMVNPGIDAAYALPKARGATGRTYPPKALARS